MRKKIINTDAQTYETRDYVLIDPSWLGVIHELPREEAGKLFTNLCLKYGRQPNRTLIPMDEKTEVVFKMILEGQEVLDTIAKLPDSREWVDYTKEDK